MSDTAHTTSTAQGFPAVAANPPVHTGAAPATAGVSSLIIAPADAAGGREQPFSWSSWALPADGITPVDGWMLFTYPEDDSDGFTTTGYFASNGERDVFFNHARFWFDPTQDRFEYLVRADFPSFGGIGPFTNEDVDFAIVQARRGLAEAQARAIAMVLS